MAGAPGNWADHITDSLLNVSFPGRYGYASPTSTSPVTNTSAPAAVLQALFQFSDKYPVTVKLLVQANRNGYSPADPGSF